MTFDPEAEREVDFGRYWRLLAARWWVVAGGHRPRRDRRLRGRPRRQPAVQRLGDALPRAAVHRERQRRAPGRSRRTRARSARSRTRSRSTSASRRSARRRSASFRSGISTKPIAGSLSKNGQNPLVSLTVLSAKKKVAACAANQLAKAVIARISGYAVEKIASFSAQISERGEADQGPRGRRSTIRTSPRPTSSCCRCS